MCEDFEADVNSYVVEDRLYGRHKNAVCDIQGRDHDNHFISMVLSCI